MSSQAVTPESWQRYKSVLYELWIQRGMTTTQVMEEMQQRYNFNPSQNAKTRKNLYDRQFKSWGWNKNLSPEQWCFVEQHTRKRKREDGKDSEVRHNGAITQVSQKVKKSRFTIIEELAIAKKYTQLPENVMVYTPGNAVEQIRIENLPWNLFLRQSGDLFRHFISHSGADKQLSAPAATPPSQDDHARDAYLQAVMKLNTNSDTLPQESKMLQALILSVANNFRTSEREREIRTDIMDLCEKLDKVPNQILKHAFSSVTGDSVESLIATLIAELFLRDDTRVAQILIPLFTFDINEVIRLDDLEKGRLVDMLRSTAMAKIFRQHGGDLSRASQPFRRFSRATLKTGEADGLYQQLINARHVDTASSWWTIMNTDNISLLQTVLDHRASFPTSAIAAAFLRRHTLLYPRQVLDRGLASDYLGSQWISNVGHAVLAWASANGCLAVAEYVVRCNVELDTLHSTVSPPVIKYQNRLTFEATPESSRTKFRSALQLAISYDHVDIANALLDAGAKPGKLPGATMESPFELALLGRHQKLASRLLDHLLAEREIAATNSLPGPRWDEIIPAVINSKDRAWFQKVLSAAREAGALWFDGTLASLFIAALDMEQLDWKDIIFNIAEDKDILGAERVISAARGINTSRLDEAFGPLLDDALHHRSDESVSRLLQLGARLTFHSYERFGEQLEQRTASFVVTAIENKRFDLVRDTIEVDADIDVVDDWRSPLTAALGLNFEAEFVVGLHQHEVVQQLVEVFSAKVYDTGAIPEPLLVGFESGCAECVALLMRHGACVTSETIEQSLEYCDLKLLDQLLEASAHTEITDRALELAIFHQCNFGEEAPILEDSTLGRLLHARSCSSGTKSCTNSQCLSRTAIPSSIGKPIVRGLIAAIPEETNSTQLNSDQEEWAKSIDGGEDDRDQSLAGWNKVRKWIGSLNIDWSLGNFANTFDRPELWQNGPHPMFWAYHWLLERGVTVDMETKPVQANLKALCSNTGCTPLESAVKAKDTAVLSWLLQRGADPSHIREFNIDVDGIKSKVETTPFLQAVRLSDLLTLSELVTHGADVHRPAQGRLGRTALQASVEHGRPEIMRFLIRGHRVSPNEPPAPQSGLTALQMAAFKGRIDIAHELLEADADVNADRAEIDGYTALEVASKYGRLDMVQLLINAGADISDSEFGEVQFRNSVDMAREEGFPVIVRLLKTQRNILHGIRSNEDVAGAKKRDSNDSARWEKLEYGVDSAFSGDDIDAVLGSQAWPWDFGTAFGQGFPS